MCSHFGGKEKKIEIRRYRESDLMELTVLLAVLRLLWRVKIVKKRELFGSRFFCKIRIK